MRLQEGTLNPLDANSGNYREFDKTNIGQTLPLVL